jgi:16S rRNA (guanine527-N7)-methyltransferase
MILPGLNVSRETDAGLRRLVDLVVKWTVHINLVSSSSISDIWTRHVLDSAQLFNYLPAGANHWVDLGSGGGFPGLVVGVIAKELAPGLQLTLVESDQRKATFLRSAARELDLSVDVQTTRIELASPLCADILSARALGSLTQLLGHAKLHMSTTGIGLFPKGRTANQEIEIARRNWRFDLTSHASMTDEDAQILRIENILHV